MMPRVEPVADFVSQLSIKAGVMLRAWSEFDLLDGPDA